ncbi:MAG TPA: hypothetical protein VGS20_15260 [Candidatus Acidoferrales bacterium]|nr:hypothetical protein [Candidatus Acidoferrales bacterium]
MADFDVAPTEALATDPAIAAVAQLDSSPSDSLRRGREILAPPGASNLEAMSRKIASQYDLDGDLVASICQDASNWDPWRVEYDGMFYVSHVAPLVENRMLTNLTEARARAFRWGLMGILGHRARLAGYEGRLAELLEPGVGLDFGCRLLRQMLAAMAEGANPIEHWRGWQVRGV